MVSPSVPALPSPAAGPVLVEGGHYTLGRGGAPVLSETTIWTFARAAAEVAELRRADRAATVGLMVGDLALPSGRRPAGGDWAVPDAYRPALDAAGLTLADVQVWTESYARNQGKRRLLDAARRDHDPRQTYAAEGWAFFVTSSGELNVVSDASLAWDGDLHGAVVTRGVSPLCPLVFAGLKRAVFQAGFPVHVAHYALADDAWIDEKLRAAAAVAAQLRRGNVGMQIDRLYRVGPDPHDRTWDPRELVAPGEEPWEAFLASVRSVRPDLSPLDRMETIWKPKPDPECTLPSGTSRCSG